MCGFRTRPTVRCSTTATLFSSRSIRFINSSKLSGIVFPAYKPAALLNLNEATKRQSAAPRFLDPVLETGNRVVKSLFARNDMRG
jgi:hypothetical protein